MDKFSVIITAGGTSSRYGNTNKLLEKIKDKTVIEETINKFINFENITEIIISANITIIPELSILFKDSKIKIIEGGATRQKSVFNALQEVENDYVLIHDGARPFVSTDLIYSVLQATKEFKAAAPGLVPTDTIKVIDKSGFLVQHLERASLTAIQTPQGFSFEELYEAHKKAALDGHDYTDDTEIWGKYLGKVKLVPGQPENKKITYPGDMPGEAAL